jgi:hypothetical protein
MAAARENRLPPRPAVAAKSCPAQDRQAFQFRKHHFQMIVADPPLPPIFCRTPSVPRYEHLHHICRSIEIIAGAGAIEYRHHRVIQTTAIRPVGSGLQCSRWSVTRIASRADPIAIGPHSRNVADRWLLHGFRRHSVGFQNPRATDDGRGGSRVWQWFRPLPYTGGRRFAQRPATSSLPRAWRWRAAWTRKPGQARRSGTFADSGQAAAAATTGRIWCGRTVSAISAPATPIADEAI